MPEMIALGTERLTQALTAAGFVPEVCTSATELRAALARLAGRDDVALVACGESQAEPIADAVTRFREASDAMVVILPDGPEPRRVGYELVRKAIEQAAGADLIGRAAEHVRTRGPHD